MASANILTIILPLVLPLVVFTSLSHPQRAHLLSIFPVRSLVSCYPSAPLISSKLTTDKGPMCITDPPEALGITKALAPHGLINDLKWMQDDAVFYSSRPSAIAWGNFLLGFPLPCTLARYRISGDTVAISISVFQLYL